MSLAVDRLQRFRPAGSSLELWSWYFFRVSGVLLLFLAYGHFAIMHVIYSVDVIDYNFVAGRWASVFWRTYDWFLLVLALAHGMNGMRVIVDDYVHPRGWRLVAQSTLWVVFLFLLGLGSMVIFTFTPVEHGA